MKLYRGKEGGERKCRVHKVDIFPPYRSNRNAHVTAGIKAGIFSILNLSSGMGIAFKKIA